MQYFVFWKQCLDQSYFWLVEIITEIRGNSFQRNSLFFTLGKLIFRLVEIIVSSIFRRPLPVFLRLVEKYFSRKSLFPASGNGF